MCSCMVDLFIVLACLSHTQGHTYCVCVCVCVRVEGGKVVVCLPVHSVVSLVAPLSGM